MASLSQAAGYGVLALGFVAAGAGKPQLVRTIAESCDLPAPYLSKIVHKLARSGLVHTQRGINGGVSLAKSADQITLLDVCEALDDPILEQRCMLGVSVCSDARACPAHAFNVAHRQQVLTFLKSTTIADVAAFETTRRWKHPGIELPQVAPDAPGAPESSGQADSAGETSGTSGSMPESA